MTILSRLEVFLDDIKDGLDDPIDLAAVLTNGDVEIPDWAHIAESTDHLKIWDDADGSVQLGFVTIDY